MSTNVCPDRFEDKFNMPAPAGSPGSAPLPSPARTPSRCDRIIALIDAALNDAERVAICSTTPLGLEMDEALDPRGGPPVFAMHDEAGRCYLAAQAGLTPTTTTWLCAPISQFALRCMLTGRADARVAFLHSQTGYVIAATVDQTGTETMSIKLCAELGDDLLPSSAGPALPAIGHRPGRRSDSESGFASDTGKRCYLWPGREVSFSLSAFL